MKSRAACCSVDNGSRLSDNSLAFLRAMLACVAPPVVVLLPLLVLLLFVNHDVGLLGPTLPLVAIGLSGCRNGLFCFPPSALPSISLKCRNSSGFASESRTCTDSLLPPRFGDVMLPSFRVSFPSAIPELYIHAGVATGSRSCVEAHAYVAVFQ